MQRDLSGRLEALEFFVDPTYRPLPIRCDVFLTARYERRSRNQMQAIFKEKRVEVDGRPVNASLKLKGGETIRIILPQDENYVAPEEIALDVLHEEEDYMVINKEPGIMMHPAGGVLSGTLLNALHHHFEKKGDPLRPGLLQRLDKFTSGLLVVAKNDDSHRKIQDQLVSHDLDKVYLAICDGTPEPPEAFVEAPLDEVEHPFKKKMGVVPGGKPAKTLYTTLATWGEVSLLGIRLYTGRQHQIRVHMAHVGHPLVGDDLYGGSRKLGRQALHSYFLKLMHPKNGREVDHLAPLSDDFREFLEALGSPRSVDHNLDMCCSDRPWNPRTWLHKIHNS